MRNTSFKFAFLLTGLLLIFLHPLVLSEQNRNSSIVANQLSSGVDKLAKSDICSKNTLHSNDLTDLVILKNNISRGLNWGHLILNFLA